MSNNNLKDIILCNESIDFQSKQLFCSFSVGNDTNGQPYFVNIKNPASTLEEARTKTI